jgi:UDP-2-acetamido-2,6-beta-L-arabino-hexul-4-ose reductase
MKTVVVTGSEGFLGLHSRFFLHEKERAEEVQVRAVGRELLNNPSEFAEALKGADILFHLAGSNKGSDEELEEGNIELARKAVEACRAADAHPHIVYSSSIHEDRDTPYGRGKKKAGDVLTAFAKESGGSCTTIVFPHLFGEFAKPNYNSAVATFCNDLAEGNDSTVNPEGEVELLYVRNAVKRMWDAAEKGEHGQIRMEGTKMNIQALYDLLAAHAKQHRKNVFIETSSELELALFNTLHSYLFHKMYPIELEEKKDERGVLFEIERSGRVDQVFYSTTKPGKSRGNHYHTRKMERFCVVQGEGEISVRRILSDTKKTFRVSGDKPVAIDMPTYYTHSLTNVGEEDLHAVFWISEQLNPDDPDTFSEQV